MHYLLQSENTIANILGYNNSKIRWVQRLLLPNVKFKTVSKHYKYFASQYSELADKFTPVQALSSLSLNRVEIKRIGDNRKEDLLDQAEDVISDQHNKLLIIDIAYHKAINEGEKQKEQEDERQSIAKDTFFKKLTPYFEREPTSTIKVAYLYDYAESYFKITWKLKAVKDLIETVISKDYPTSVEEELDKEEYQKQNLGGRPEDASADQQAIIKKVDELSNKKRFQKKDGTPKPTTIRDEIWRNYPELAGEISRRALFDRVKKALVLLDMN